MKCSICNNILENNDNYCPKCGNVTTVGYMYLKDNHIKDGYSNKNINRFKGILTFFSLTIIIFLVLTIVKGNGLFSPIFYLEKEINKYIYGYNTSLIKTDNTYYNVEINNVDDAYKMVKKDFDRQELKCYKNNEVVKIEENLEYNYDIISVNFCDITTKEVNKINEVIKRIYDLFPNIKGYLTNITITNAKEKEEYVAYFEPRYEFVNSNSTLNKVNKTQILLNSYYYLNEEILNSEFSATMGNYYVNNASFESLIAHEFGHYITFVSYLKQNGIKNIMLVNRDNEDLLNKTILEYDSGNYQEDIVRTAYNNYITKYNVIEFSEFVGNISKYALIKENNTIQYNETIAEAVHDYYLNALNASKSSLEIVSVLKSRLNL